MIIDDSYNASPLSMHAAFETVEHLDATRNVGILGDMLELGAYTLEAHEKIGEEAADIFDILITIGAGGKLIADGAKKNRMKQKNISSFDTALEAMTHIETTIKKGDLILIKASRALALNEISHTLKQV